MKRWRLLPRRYVVEWPDNLKLRAATEVLEGLPGLVPMNDCLVLEAELAAVVAGQGLVIQAGDCAETFERNCPSYVSGTVQMLADTSALLERVARVRCTPVARFAGQFAKPRTRSVDHDGLPIWRGDLINSRIPTADARVPDASNLLLAYDNARLALSWGRTASPGVYASHEAFVLEYEEALTRPVLDSVAPRRTYAASAHFLWVGYRTNDPDGAHIAFAAQVANPIGVKVGPETSPSQFIKICQTLNPDRRPGRLTIIVRLGRDALEYRLPEYVRRARDAGMPILWLCDPMHANNKKTAEGVAIRFIHDIICEVESYVAVLASLGEWPGGLHLEATSDPVQECYTNSEVSPTRPRTHPAVDARLNATQLGDVARHFGDALLRYIGESKVRSLEI